MKDTEAELAIEACIGPEVLTALRASIRLLEMILNLRFYGWCGKVSEPHG